jgi:hypothetical protein
VTHEDAEAFRREEARWKQRANGHADAPGEPLRCYRGEQHLAAPPR